MKYLVAAVAVASVFAITPASAKSKMMKCTGENMAKSVTALAATPDTPKRQAMFKEIGVANAAMAKGNMRAACKSYMKVQMM